MYNDQFIKRYKTIPIAGYSQFKPAISETSVIAAIHLHKEFEIIYIREGKAKITVNHNSFIAEKGDLVFVSPYSLHEIETIPNENFSHICFCFDLNLLPDKALSEKLLSGNLIVTPQIKTSSVHNPELVSGFEKINDAMSSYPPHWELAVQGNLNLMFYYIIKNSLVSSGFSSAENNEFCIKVSRFINEHYKEKLTSLVIADKMNLHQGYFCRIFKKNFRRCFSDYLNIFRLEKAKFLLIKSDIPITEVALESGYDNPSYFSRVFRIHNGISPGEFRKSN